LQGALRDGVFAEIAHWRPPASRRLPVRDDRPATELIGLAKLIVPFGGLQRSGCAAGKPSSSMARPAISARAP